MRLYPASFQNHPWLGWDDRIEQFLCSKSFSSLPLRKGDATVSHSVIGGVPQKQVAATSCHVHGPAGHPSCQRTQYCWSPVCPLGSIDTKMLPEDDVYKVNNDNYRLQQHMVPVLASVTNAGKGGTFLAPGIYIPGSFSPPSRIHAKPLPQGETHPCGFLKGNTPSLLFLSCAIV